MVYAASGGESIPKRFKITDEKFWLKWQEEENFERLFSMKVQWIYDQKNNKKTNVEVLKVLDLKGTLISSPLTEDECKKIIDERTVRSHGSPRETDPFDTTSLWSAVQI